MDISSAGAGPPAIRVFVLSGHELVCRALSDLLNQAGFEVTGVADRIAAAVPAAARTAPDVALLSNRVADGTGIEACRALRDAAPRTRSIIMTTYDEQKALRGAAMAGAAGFVLQTPRTGQLIEAVQRVAAGEQLHSPECARAALLSLSAAPALQAAPAHEHALWSLILQGKTNAEIMSELALTHRQFCTDLSALLARLGYFPAPS